MIIVFLFLCLLVQSTIIMGQDGIQVESSLSVEDLVKDVFIRGNCKNVSNIKALGNDSISIGQFSNAENIFGFDDGIIISTGDISLAGGPNVTIDESFSFLAESNDQDLSILATDQLFDVTGIEFDFVPIGNRVTFKYVFASEEYCEFVGTSFNDVFGFFVSGPGINGSFADDAVNVALLPGTNINVSINNVNHQDNTQFYVGNETSTDVENCDINYVETFQELIEYDGFTVTLFASFDVTSCETYKIRLVIGDVGDAMLDSAVFLESKSFDLGEKIDVRVEVPGSDEPVAFENCIDGQIVFTRSNLNNLLDDCTIEYDFSPDSDAISGLDFEEIPLSITIPAGDSSFVLPIKILEDNLTEGRESLRLEFKYECDCIAPSSSELIIDEIESWQISIEPLSACAGQPFVIVPEIISGVEPFAYLWENGTTGDSLELTLTDSSNYGVTVTDACGNTRVAIAEVVLQSIPSATLFGSYDLCDVMDEGIPISLQGTAPWSLQYDINGEPQVPIEDIGSEPYYIMTSVEGNYSLTGFSDANCLGTFSGSAEVGYNEFDVKIVVTPVSCPFRNDGRIEITELVAIDPYTIEWNIRPGQDFIIDSLGADIYILNITDGNGCLYQQHIDVSVDSENLEDCIPLYIPNVFSPNSDGANDIFTVFANTNGLVSIVNSMQVYDRWGELIYSESNFVPDGSIGWDGTLNGKTVPVGVYTYMVVYAINELEFTIAGDIMLVN